ncbi:transcription termination/antitermination NusG family protein [Thioalkalicoccus limnaeus]|uniref:Transcription termination/antitermination NusG family protein n=1 Tax=Thioalkalicoccus limnaeus TaxID=120681 RepID=A0ABV4BGE9_9GAMM
MMPGTSNITQAHRDFDTGAPWYVVQTKPRQERLAVTHLAEQGYHTYLPLHACWKRRQRRWTRIREVYFPRYAFFSPADPQHSIAPVRSTCGVTRLVRFGNIPATIDPRVLRELHILEQTLHRLDQDTTISLFKPGDPVRLTDGPLAGLTGIISTCAKDRVTVMMILLGQNSPVTVPIDSLIHTAA